MPRLGIAAATARVLAIAGIVMLVAAVLVWPRDGVSERTPPVRSQGLATAQARLDDAERALGEWWSTKGRDDPGRLREELAGDTSLPGGPGPLPAPDAAPTDLARAEAQQRQFELASAEIRLDELQAERADAIAGLRGAVAQSDVASGVDTGSSTDEDTVRRVGAVGLGAVGAVGIAAPFLRRRRAAPRVRAVAAPPERIEPPAERIEPPAEIVRPPAPRIERIERTPEMIAPPPAPVARVRVIVAERPVAPPPLETVAPPAVVARPTPPPMSTPAPRAKGVPAKKRRRR